MKKYIIPSLRITGVLLVILCILYPLFIALAGGFSKGNGGGEKVTKDGKVVGYAALGQSFTKPEYFLGRPSAVDYNAAGSGGSNKGASNEEYLKQVSDRIDTLLKYNPTLKKADIPADIVTASASGLDPDISAQAAKIQISRVAVYRKIDVNVLTKLVDDHTEKPLLGLLGPTKVNVLNLNVALDELK